MFYRILRGIDIDLEQWVFQREEQIIVNMVLIIYLLFFVFYMTKYTIVNIILLLSILFTISLVITHIVRLNKVIREEEEEDSDLEDAPGFRRVSPRLHPVIEEHLDEETTQPSLEPSTEVSPTTEPSVTE